MKTHDLKTIKLTETARLYERTCLADGTIDYIACWMEQTRTMVKARTEVRKTLAAAERIFEKHANA